MEPTNEEIRRTLAEFMGWTDIVTSRDDRTNLLFMRGKPPAGLAWSGLPDFAYELDAMHRVESQFKDDHDASEMYVRTLLDITGGAGWDLITATAEQRARAAYRVIREMEGSKE